MSSSRTQPGGNILTWNLFCEKQAILNGFEIVGVHVFNRGNSAFLYDKNDCLYAFGDATPCFECGLAALRPRIVPLAFDGVQAIATGEEHAVLLDRGGNVYCWGENDHGQFGVGNTHSYLHPKRPRLPPISQISCGQYFTLALDLDHKVWFWGRQYFKYSGIPVRIPTRAIPTQISLPPFLEITQICAGSSIATILDNNGKIYSWGHRECGLDYGYRKGMIKPIGLEFSHRIKYLVNASNRSAFITDRGKLFVSGSAENGTYYVFTEILHCGKVLSVAASWHTDLFAVLNVHKVVFELRYDEVDTVLASGTNFKNILDVFRNTRVPSIIPPSVDCTPGIIRYTGREVSSDEEEEIGARWEEPLSNTSTEERVSTPRVVMVPSVFSVEPVEPPKPVLGDKDGYVEIAYLFNSEICSDVQIKLSDGTLNAHKLVLYSKSKYFKKLIQETLNDSKIIDMSNWSSESYKCYIKYLYTGKLEITSDEYIPEIYLIAEQDTNEIVKEICIKTWREKLTKNNVVRFFGSAFNCQLQGFLAECSLLLSQNLPSILVSEDYCKLSESAKLSLALTAALHGRK
ncbi:hypothetical protein O3M35_006498 [Rhynocoris fuscipes]|uniref:BTB domain-containing protein n=1 Tax=Rhynocoris fuscipes TaxID=488301 RepID=A0AAW1DEI9_9HEMI